MVDTIVLVVIAAALLGAFFIFIQINNFIGIIKIKGEVDVYLNIQDQGTQLLSFLKSQKSGTNYMGMLGSYAAKDTPDEYDKEITSTLQKLGDYDLFVQNQSQEIIKEFKSVNSPAGGQNIGVVIKLDWPLKNHNTINNGYGWRDLSGKRDFHGGLDFAVTEEEVYSAYPTGKVVRMGKGCEPSPNVCANVDSCATSNDQYCCCNSGLGNFVVIKHEISGETFYTHYDHLKEVYVHMNDEIGKDIMPDQPIAKSGNTGYIQGENGYHLHFEMSKSEIKSDDASIDPCIYFPQPVPVNCEQESHRPAGLSVDIPLPNGQVGEVSLIT